MSRYVLGLMGAAVALGVFALAACAAPGGLYGGKRLPRRAKVDRIVISKSKHRLYAYRGKVLLKVYKVAIGSGGAGDKQYAGDKRTPEGRYRIIGRHHSASYHRFLLISYPNAADRRRYTRARKAGKVPAGRGIGGSIGIHGERRGLGWLPHKWVDWTFGCIAVDDDEIDELYRSVRPRASVRIDP